MRGLDTYLSYRIGLRTLSDTESRTVLDTPDAARLPALPGHGYLKVDVTTYDRFKAAFVSGPLGGPAEEVAPAPGPAGDAHGPLRPHRRARGRRARRRPCVVPRDRRCCRRW